MKNFEKYKTADERTEAWKMKEGLSPYSVGVVVARELLGWLEMEAEEEQPLPCPFCGKELSNASIAYKSGMMDLYQGYSLHCIQCGYRSRYCTTRDETVASHNRIAKCIMEEKK